MSKRSIYFLLIIFFFSATVNLGFTAYEENWTKPIVLYETAETVSNPLIVSDIFGGVHVFWRYAPYEGNPDFDHQIFHTQLNDGKWSNPSDILMSPEGGSIGGMQVFSDQQGLLHFLWRGTNNTLYYSQSPSLDADRPQSWSIPIAIATSLNNPGFFVNENGIHVVYPGVNRDGLFYIYSTDFGSNWSEPVIISEPTRFDSAVDYTQIAVDKQGNLHVAWTEFVYPQSWPPTGVYFASSTDRGFSWSSPIELASGEYDQATVRIDSNGVIHTYWNGAVSIGGRFHVFSVNGGATWSVVSEVIQKGIGGTSGYPDADFDSDNQMHLVTPVDWQGGIQYLRFLGFTKGWSEPQKIYDDFAGTRVQSIEQSQLAVSGGNELHVVFEVGFQRIYYSSMRTAAHSISPVPTLISNNDLSFVQAQTLTPEIVPSGDYVQSFEKNTPTTGQPVWFPILIGSLPVIVIMGYFALKITFRRK